MHPDSAYEIFDSNEGDLEYLKSRSKIKVNIFNDDINNSTILQKEKISKLLTIDTENNQEQKITVKTTQNHQQEEKKKSIVHYGDNDIYSIRYFSSKEQKNPKVTLINQKNNIPVEEAIPRKLTSQEYINTLENPRYKIHSLLLNKPNNREEREEQYSIDPKKIKSIENYVQEEITQEEFKPKLTKILNKPEQEIKVSKQFFTKNKFFIGTGLIVLVLCLMVYLFSIVEFFEKDKQKISYQQEISNKLAMYEKTNLTIFSSNKLSYLESFTLDSPSRLIISLNSSNEIKELLSVSLNNPYNLITSIELQPKESRIIITFKTDIPLYSAELKSDYKTIYVNFENEEDLINHEDK